MLIFLDSSRLSLEIYHISRPQAMLFSRNARRGIIRCMKIMPGVVTGPRGQERSIFFEWLVKLADIFFDFVKEQVLPKKALRSLVAQPDRPLEGSTAHRKLDVGLVDSQAASKDTRRHWSHILVVDELKSNKGSDKTSQPGLDLG